MLGCLDSNVCVLRGVDLAKRLTPGRASKTFYQEMLPAFLPGRLATSSRTKSRLHPAHLFSQNSSKPYRKRRMREVVLLDREIEKLQ